MQLPSSRIKARGQAAVNPKLERRLWMYAAAASAAGVGIFASTPAEAKVVVTQANTPISPSVALDLNHDGFVDFNLTKWKAAASIELFSYLAVCHEGYQHRTFQCVSSSTQANAANVVRVTSSGAQDLPFGAPIGPGQHFGGTGVRVVMGGRHVISSASFHEQTWYGPWVAGGAGVKNRYLGFKFKIGIQFHFGWARVTVATTADHGFSATLTGYAYETIPGKPIHAGATSDAAQSASEPGLPSIDPREADRQASLGMLSLGSLGVTLWRREDS
ncbi:MAG TPA: hypothetical protein VI386_12695 [Candidatus Sulfotelmatobacter sp.]